VIRFYSLKARHALHALHTDATPLTTVHMFKSIFNFVPRAVNMLQAPCHHNPALIIGNFMVHQDRLETYVLQPFAHPETSE